MASLAIGTGLTSLPQRLLHTQQPVSQMSDLTESEIPPDLEGAVSFKI